MVAIIIAIIKTFVTYLTSKSVSVTERLAGAGQIAILISKTEQLGLAGSGWSSDDVGAAVSGINGRYFAGAGHQAFSMLSANLKSCSMMWDERSRELRVDDADAALPACLD